MIFIGCAGWSLRKQHFAAFPESGSHLERYAARFNCVEINSSFYRSHRNSTYQRWAEATPAEFRFAVKLPKVMTHVNRLAGCRDAIAQFSAEVGGLGCKLGAVLVQLPPSLPLEAEQHVEFFKQLAESVCCSIVIEPRHASWFDDGVDSLLAGGVGRVAADPPVVPTASEPISANGLVYYRWHGSPRVYYSSYDDLSLVALAQRLVSEANASRDVWCIFDNTAEGAATINAASMRDHVLHALAREQSHAVG